MTSLIATLVALAFVVIPIVVVVKILRRLQRMTRGIGDPARLQRVFAEHAADALRRAGADPRTVAKLEVLRSGPAAPRTADRNAQAYEARIGLQRRPLRASVPPPPLETDPAPPPRRASRPRVRRSHAPVGGLDLGESFRLSQPPDRGEPHAPAAISNWIAVALIAGAAAWWFVR